MLNLQNIEDAKDHLQRCDLTTFKDDGNSYKYFLKQVEIDSFRHINNFSCSFDHPVTVIAGANKIGKTSILLLIACSHDRFMRYDSTAVDTSLRIHNWSDMLNFTSHENASRNYSYKLFWRLGKKDDLKGEGKRTSTNKSWAGLGKRSSDPKRTNAKIRDREVRLIDLERIHPTRNSSNSLKRKINTSNRAEIKEDIEQAFAYILDIPAAIRIYRIGSHVSKIAYLIEREGCDNYSSYNAASGEEALLNILTEIFDTPENSLILIDEIEAGFHPVVQRKLVDVIQYVSWIQKKQFIITTHSPSLMSAFPQQSRKYIEVDTTGCYKTIPKISVATAFSKMDSISHPLVQLYCEDELAKFIIRKIMVDINSTHKHFDRLFNIITSGAVNEVYDDYKVHKKNYRQLTLKMGYCCVLDGDSKHDQRYSHLEEEHDFGFFLSPHTAPEKFLVNAFLKENPNNELSTALNNSDHHTLFNKMADLGLASDYNDARSICWGYFTETEQFTTLKNELSDFLIKVAKHFSEESD
jgi:predicted ATPase